MFNIEEKIELLTFTIPCPHCAKSIQIYSQKIPEQSFVQLEFLSKENQLLKEEVLNLRLANRQLTRIA